MSIYVGFCGAPSSGKTCLARSMTNALCLKGHNADYVPEYARFHIARCKQYPTNNPRNLLHQHMILENQLEWENVISPAVEFVVSDSPVVMTAVYAYSLTDFTDYNQVAFYHKHYQRILELKNRYKYLFYLPSTDIEFKTDGLRSQDKERAQEIGNKIKAFLTFHDILHYEITGSLDERVNKCLSIMGISS